MTESTDADPGREPEGIDHTLSANLPDEPDLAPGADGGSVAPVPDQESYRDTVREDAEKSRALNEPVPQEPPD
jgi:hypothetical protein